MGTTGAALSSRANVVTGRGSPKGVGYPPVREGGCSSGEKGHRMCGGRVLLSNRGRDSCLSYAPGGLRRTVVFVLPGLQDTLW